MARWEPWPVIDGAYKDDARPWSAQDTVNWLPTPAEQAGTRSAVMLRTPPGLVPFCDLGTDAPIRGQHDVEGLHLVVSDTTLFRITPEGVATAIGTIPGVGRVSMDHTPRGAGFHVGIANGQSGYIYDTADNSLTQITDEGFPGAVIFQFIDGYLAFLEPFGRFWGHSELNDGLSYNTLDRYTAESAPDGIVSLIVSHREVFVLGTRTGEFFRNTGAQTGTFARADGYEMERGICAPFAIARSDNTVKWVGDDGCTYRLEGHQPVRISTGPIDQAFGRANLRNAFAFPWEDKGHNVFYATLPDGHTWGHDAWTGRWHRRQSYSLNRWRLATLVKTGGQWIGGDYTNGKLYTLSWDDDAVHENGDPLVSERTFPVAHDFGNDLIVNGIRLLFDTGRPSIGAPSISGDVPGGDVGDAISGAYTVVGGITPYGPVTVLSGTFPPGLTLNADGTYSGVAAMSGTYSWVVGGVDAFGQPFSTPDTATYVGVSVWIAQQDLSENYARSASGTNWQEEANRIHAGFSTQHVSALDGRIITGAAATASYAQSIDGALTFAAYPAMPEGTSSGGKTIKVDGVYLSPRGQLPTNGVARTADLGGSWSTVLVSGSGTNTMHAISARIGLAIVGTSGGRVSRSLDNGASWSALVQVFPPGVGIQGIANNGDRFVLVGDDHTMMYTDDGLTFHPITSPFTRSGGTASQNVIGAVACGNGVFVAGVDTAVGGTAGQLAYSLDGENFVTTAVGLGGGCLCLAYADGLFVAAGRNSKIATSPDGPNWTQRDNNFAGDIRSVTALIGPPLVP